MFEGLLQPMHLLVILVISLLVFGPKKLPELGKGLGDGIRSFKGAMAQEQEERRGVGGRPASAKFLYDGLLCLPQVSVQKVDANLGGYRRSLGCP